MTSSLNKHVASKGIVDTQEQSGWTAYLEDFSLNQREHSSYSDDSFCSPSLVSDAASYPARKIISDKNQVNTRSSLDPSEFPKRLNFNKPRKRFSYDDDLEDTASSPVNSPKVRSVKQMDIDSRRPGDSIGNLLGKYAGSTSYPISGVRTVEKSSINYDAKGNDFTELRKRGLCLVPLSMLVNNNLD